MTDGPAKPAARAATASRRTGASLAERRARRADETDPAVVLAAAVRFLEARPRSVAEVRRRLRQAGYQVALVDAAVDRLEQLAFLDDEAFARSWVESRDRARPRGERALRVELAGKGIDRGVIDRVLEERRTGGARSRSPWEAGRPDDSAVLDPDDAAARRLLERHGRAFARIGDPRVRRQRAYALLARNGFDPDVTSRVARLVDTTIDDADGADEDRSGSV